MPIVRRRITRDEEIEYLERAQWLNSAGAAIEVPGPRPEQLSLDICQYGPEFDNITFTLYPGRAVVVVGISLLARKTGIMIENVRLMTPWDAPEFYLWGTADEELPYRLCRGVEFSRDYVLNHLMDERMRLRRGVPVEGLIIATSLAPLPPEYNHGARLSLVVEFLDQFGTDYPLQAEVRVNRRIGGMERLARPTRRAGLFDLSEEASSIHEPERPAISFIQSLISGQHNKALERHPELKRGARQ